MTEEENTPSLTIYLSQVALISLIFLAVFVIKFETPATEFLSISTIVITIIATVAGGVLELAGYFNQ